MRPAFLVLAAASLSATIVASSRAQEDAAPIFGITLPPGYREWKVISVAHEAGKLNDLRAILGNDIAYKAAREGQLPYPDGSIVARVAWSYEPLPESAEAFGQAQSFVAGKPTNVQFMVKDSTKYASTGGWGFAQFDNNKPAGEAVHNACFACHAIAKGRDLVFNRYAP
ncbi:MAG: cytochrome P460 family protein [Reyranella sp.]|nr:cytochrome P460 family protein [Reyranella sp.]